MEVVLWFGAGMPESCPQSPYGARGSGHLGLATVIGLGNYMDVSAQASHAIRNRELRGDGLFMLLLTTAHANTLHPNVLLIALPSYTPSN